MGSFKNTSVNRNKVITDVFFFKTVWFYKRNKYISINP
jgi:hypothetical protein